MFSQLPGSVFWCLILTWRNSQSLFQIFPLFLSFLLLLEFLLCIYYTFCSCLSYLYILFCFIIFVLFAFWFLRIILIYPVTRILVLLRSLDDAMLPHTSGQFAGSMFLLVVDPGKPYTPTNPSRLGVNRILYKTFPDSTEQTCNSLYYAYNCVLDH